MLGGNLHPVPLNVSPPERQWMRRTNVQLEQMSRLAGVNVAGGTMPTEVPNVPEFITGQIRIEGSGSGSGISLNPAGVGFTDEDGYLAYAFDQTYDDVPWKGTIVPEGISTVLPGNGSTEGVNYAYPLNSDYWEEGANVLLRRAGNHWIILGGMGDASGSGGGGMTITCQDGTSYPVTISGNTITVGNAL